MANAKKIHIRTVTFERYSTSVRPATAISLFCTGCNLLTEMLPMSEASAEAGVSMRELFWLSENGPIHSVETAAGQILICRESLKAIGDLSGITENILFGRERK